MYNDEDKKQIKKSSGRQRIDSMVRFISIGLDFQDAFQRTRILVFKGYGWLGFHRSFFKGMDQDFFYRIGIWFCFLRIFDCWYKDGDE